MELKSLTKTRVRSLILRIHKSSWPNCCLHVRNDPMTEPVPPALSWGGKRSPVLSDGSLPWNVKRLEGEKGKEKTGWETIICTVCERWRAEGTGTVWKCEGKKEKHIKKTAGRWERSSNEFNKMRRWKRKAVISAVVQDSVGCTEWPWGRSSFTGKELAELRAARRTQSNGKQGKQFIES